MEKLLLKPSEVQQLLGCGRSIVYRLISEGDIPSVRVGRCIRVQRKSLDKWIVDHENAKGDGRSTTVSNASALSKD